MTGESSEREQRRPGSGAAEVRVGPIEGADDRAAVFRIREEVFVGEQACPPDEEFDAWDDEARHLLARVGDDPAGTARWRRVDGRAKLERFAVLRGFRGLGVGAALVRAALDDARAAGMASFVLHAQIDKRGLYERFGFRGVGETFREAGIEHVRMVLDD